MRTNESDTGLSTLSSGRDGST